MALTGDTTKRVIVEFVASDTNLSSTFVAIDGRARDVRGRFISADAAADAMGRSIKRAGRTGEAAMGGLRGEVRAARLELRRAVKAGGDFLNKMKNVGLIGLGFSTVANGIMEVVNAVDELATQSLEIQQVSNNLAFGLDKAAEATEGYVDNLTLAKNANKAFALGVAKDSTEFAELVGAATKIAQAQGIDAQKLVEQAVVGIGRKSAARLDDLGILLNQTKAERIYAESLGRTANELTLLEKETAFQKAALIEIKKAGDRAAASIDGFAVTVAKGKITLQNTKQEMLGFDDSLGRVRESLRGISDEDLDQLRFASMARDATRLGRAMNKALGEFGTNLRGLRGAADELGVSYDELIAGQIEFRKVANVESVIKGLNQVNQIQIRNLQADAEFFEQRAAVTSAEGGSQRTINKFLRDAVELRRDAAQLQAMQTESTADEAKLLKLNRALEVADATKVGGGGRRRDPNEAIDRERDAALRLVSARKQLISAEQELTREADVQAARQALLIELSQDQLDLREEAASQRDPRGAGERDELEAELLAIRTERTLAGFELRKLIQADEQRADDQRIAAMDREIERLQALGVATQILEQQRAEAIEAGVERFGTAEEMREHGHEREIERIDAVRAAEVEDEQRKVDAVTREIELAQARGQTIDGLAQQQLQLQARVAAAEGDEDGARQLRHRAELTRISERLKADKAAVANSGKALTQGRQLAGLVIDASIKDGEKAQRAKLKVQGFEALGIAALEGVKAAASFASFNFVEGALHVAAGIAAAVQGATLIAGRVPGGGGGSAAAASSSGAQGGAGTSAAATIPGSTPAADRQPAAVGGQGATQQGGIVFAGDVNISALGTIDDEAAEKIGISIGNAALGREAV